MSWEERGRRQGTSRVRRQGSCALWARKASGMARSDENIRKARVSGPFKKTGRDRTRQIPASAFEVHVHLCVRKPESQREAVALATGECDWSPNFSDYTAGDGETINCTLVDWALTNPQLCFERAVCQVSGVSSVSKQSSRRACAWCVFETLKTSYLSFTSGVTMIISPP